MGLKMKKNEIGKRGMVRVAQNGILVLMLVLVLCLTASVIALLALNAAFEGNTVFDMEQFIQTDEGDKAVIGEHLLPSFIGIRAKGEQRGISAGYNTVYDIYTMFHPVLSDVLNDSFKAVSKDRFGNALASSSFVYMKYHTPLPWQAIYACAGGMEESYDASLSVYELLILPDQGFGILVRTINGDVFLFEGTNKSYFAANTLSDLLQSYQRNMVDFVFDSDSGKEPQFTERIRTKNMLVTEKTAALIQNRETHISAILRVMNFNPDKLYAHDESDIGVVYVENHGVLRLLDESVEYTAASADGGISVDLFTSRYGKTGYTLQDYMKTTSVIINQVRELSPHYAGGDAELLLSSVLTEKNGSVTFSYMYSFDNLRLSGCETALEVSYRNGKLTDFRLFSVSVKNLGVQENSLLEGWYYGSAQENCPEGWRIVDVCPVYRTDFYADSISAEWSVVYGTASSELKLGDFSNRSLK